MEVLSQLKELKRDIAASLYMKPATFEELMERDFLHNRSEYGISIMLQQMENARWIYIRWDRYHTYKKFALSTEMAEYELEGF